MTWQTRFNTAVLSDGERERLRLKVAVERERRRRMAARSQSAPPDWQSWLPAMFPDYFTAPFSDRHGQFWRWVEAIEQGVEPRPFVAIWPRGGAKSTNAEAATVRLGARQARRYIWYVSETQDQADEHVASISQMLESPPVEYHYPMLARRAVNKYGSSKGWRRNRLRTAAGLTVDALGMDTARRGFKIEMQRPDMMIFDDVDAETDKPEATEKKEATITKRLLPAGTADCAILCVQNMIIPHGMFARLADGRASYLARRQVSGPHPAIEGLITENVDGRDLIRAGTATWAGQGLAACQAYIDKWGLESFLAECQHQVRQRGSHPFDPAWWADGRNRYDSQDKGVANRVVGRWLLVDTALKDKGSNDPSAALTAELWPDYRVAVRHIWNERVESAYLPGRLEELAMAANRDGKLRGVVIEDKGSGTTSIQSLRAFYPAWLADLVVEFQPHGSKEYRAKTAAIWCPRDCILLPAFDPALPWYMEFLDPDLGQLFRFPDAPHDDMVDTFVMMILYLEHFIAQGWHARNPDTAAAEAAEARGSMDTRPPPKRAIRPSRLRGGGLS